jgi:hypothetical protein
MKRAAIDLGSLPPRWQSSAAAVKAVQVAFDVSEQVMEAVRHAAFHAGLSNSDQLRSILGLPIVRQAVRPRLTMSLSDEDYQRLGEKFALPPSERLSIKVRVQEALMAFAESQAPARSAKDTRSASTGNKVKSTMRAQSAAKAELHARSKKSTKKEGKRK